MTTSTSRRSTSTAMRLAIHVTPRSARDGIAGWRGGELSVRVTPAPDDGKANAAVCAVLADAVGVPKSAVRIIRGHASRHKQVEVDGAEYADVVRMFGEPPQALF